MSNLPDQQFVGVTHAFTLKAVLFQDHFWHAPEWLPLSQVTVHKPMFSNEAQVRIKGWLAEKNGFYEFTEIENVEQEN